ncbi:uncharacterized protein V6R79_008715 [Siganus canaliculatus]
MCRICGESSSVELRSSQLQLLQLKRRLARAPSSTPVLLYPVFSRLFQLARHGFTVSPQTATIPEPNNRINRQQREQYFDVTLGGTTRCVADTAEEPMGRGRAMHGRKRQEVSLCSKKRRRDPVPKTSVSSQDRRVNRIYPNDGM